MRAHHFEIALEAAAGQHDCVRRQCPARAVLLDEQAGDPAVIAGDLFCLAFIKKSHTGLPGGARQFLDEDLAAADRLNAGRAFRQVIRGLNELDAQRGEPFDGGRRFLRQPREIAFVTARLGGVEHVPNEARFHALGRCHAHVGRRPARIAAGFGFRGLVGERDLDRPAVRARRFGGGQRGGEAGRALANDDEVLQWRAHDRSIVPTNGRVCQSHRIFLR
ncbi:MAG: hypothetical protein ABSF41_11815 [Pseudolabrys sp.]